MLHSTHLTEILTSLFSPWDEAIVWQKSSTEATTCYLTYARQVPVMCTFTPAHDEQPALCELYGIVYPCAALSAEERQALALHLLAKNFTPATLSYAYDPDSTQVMTVCHISLNQSVQTVHASLQRYVDCSLRANAEIAAYIAELQTPPSFVDTQPDGDSFDTPATRQHIYG